MILYRISLETTKEFDVDTFTYIKEYLNPQNVTPWQRYHTNVNENAHAQCILITFKKQIHAYKKQFHTFVWKHGLFIDIETNIKITISHISTISVYF